MSAEYSINILKRIISSEREVCPNSSSAAKAGQLEWILNNIFGHGTISLRKFIALAKEYEEPDTPNSAYVAKHKAGYFVDKLRSLNNPPVVTAGADTVFRIKHNGTWKHGLKLERLGRKLSEEELFYQYDLLYNMMCKPQNGKGEMSWDISLAIVNGETATFNEQIYIQYSPIDKELLNAYFWQAVDNGFLYKSNARMAMIEMLAVSGSVNKMAFIGENGKVKKMLREPTELLLQTAITDIISTMPTALFTGLTI